MSTVLKAELREHLSSLVSQLTLERKVELLTGDTFWSTVPLPEIGLRSMVLSDGPSGVRGERWDERDPSLNLPSSTALSASWDRSLAQSYGAASAAEAVRKNVDVILGPTINLHRSSLGGRGFECFSEDPVLTGELAAAYVDGVQAQGVGATVKHYVANDFETERLTASTAVDERTLRELYLSAFEAPVREARAWLVMSAYNSINGIRATESPLLDDPLKTEWGFDGVVVSDWGAVRSLDSAAAGQDLVMPGPGGPWDIALIEAVRSGSIPEERIDDKVFRILLLAARVGALDSVDVERRPVSEVDDGVAFARRAAAAGSVLVRNASRSSGKTLPLIREQISRIGVFGQNARFARTQGGGSATVVPSVVVSPLDGICNSFGSDRVVYRAGVAITDGLLEFPIDRVSVPGTGHPGVLVQFLKDGREIHREIRGTSMLVDFDTEEILEQAEDVLITTVYDVGDLGWMPVGFASLGRTSLSIDGVVVLDEILGAEGEELGATFLTPPVASTPVGKLGLVELQFRHDLRSRPEGTHFSFAYGLEARVEDESSLIADAVQAAADCDVAVVVVGTSSRIESEGFDRKDLRLPGKQDELVRAVAATGTPTIVIVNSGAPVLLPWRESVDALLLTWFGGQEYGSAIADVLTGAVEPGGRLPMTWPEDAALVPSVTPVDGVVTYAEGLHIGYRRWLVEGRSPAYPFGHGLGYTNFQLQDMTIQRTGDAFTVTVTVINTGDRDGKCVVQIYASREQSELDRAAQWLAGFETATVEAKSSRTLTIPVTARAFQHWDVDAHQWAVEPGRFALHMGLSATDLHGTASIEIS